MPDEEEQEPNREPEASPETDDEENESVASIFYSLALNDHEAGLNSPYYQTTHSNLIVFIHII